MMHGQKNIKLMAVPCPVMTFTKHYSSYCIAQMISGFICMIIPHLLDLKYDSTSNFETLNLRK